jgi:hypothetical protein
MVPDLDYSTNRCQTNLKHFAEERPVDVGEGCGLPKLLVFLAVAKRFSNHQEIGCTDHANDF